MNYDSLSSNSTTNTANMLIGKQTTQSVYFMTPATTIVHGSLSENDKLSDILSKLVSHHLQAVFIISTTGSCKY